MSILNDGCYPVLGQMSDLHYTWRMGHRYARICSWALTALSLFAKSITTNFHCVLGQVSYDVSNSLKYFAFHSINKRLRKQNNTVHRTVVAKIQALAPIVKSDRMPPGGRYV